MNDLAQMAVQGLHVVRRAIMGQPVTMLSVAGFAAASVTVVAGGRIGAAAAALPLNTWFGLLPGAGYRVTNLVPGLIMLAGIAGLVGLWLLVLILARAPRTTERAVWTIAVAWALPFLAGPPVLGTDIFSYVAHGLLARAGLSVYHHGPTALGESTLTNAIDPTWRSAASTAGPLASALEHLLVVVGAGNPLATVILLRALAAASVVAIGKLGADLVGRRHASALAMTVANPVTLLYLISGARLDALFVALVLAALIVAAQRRWTQAVLLVCLAAGLKPVGLIAVVAVILAHCVGRRIGFAWWPALRDGVLAAAMLAAATLVVPYGLDWTENLGVLTREQTPFAPASVVSRLLSLIVATASFDDLATGARFSVVVAGLTAIGYLLATVRTRSLERTVGCGLLAAALCGPALYPWFLSWGLLVLAPSAQRASRDWVIALSVAACILAPAGFAPRTSEVVTVCALTVIAVVLLPRVYRRYQRTASTQQRIGVG